MSQTYIGVLISFLAVILPKFGLEIGSEQLTTTISTLATIVGTLWALYGRHRLGGVSFAGLRK